MSNPKEVIPVFFSTDDGYAPYLGVALYSLIQNASTDYAYHINILYEDLSDENRRKLADMARAHVDIRFFPMEEKMRGIPDHGTNWLRADYFTPTIYFRLFIPAMFPEYDKAIYLDSDIVVPGDISALYRTELGENLIGAIPDYSIHDIPRLVTYMERGVGVDWDKYINSGILLLNAKRLREVELDRRFLELLHTYQFATIAPDQDYLNAMCYGKITFLPRVWDAMPVEGREPLEDPQLIHYNLFGKPWCYDGVQYEAYFWKYAERTPFYDQILAAKAAYSDEEKRADSEHLERMLKNSEDIVASPVNFNIVFNERNEKRL